MKFKKFLKEETLLIAQFKKESLIQPFYLWRNDMNRNFYDLCDNKHRTIRTFNDTVDNILKFLYQIGFTVTKKYIQ